jgi:hypothetical protein
LDYLPKDGGFLETEESPFRDWNEDIAFLTDDLGSALLSAGDINL